MKLTENTKVRIKVPKHLYESIKSKLQEMEDHRMEEEEQINESAVEQVMQALQSAPELYNMLRIKAQMAPHEFGVLASGIATLLGVGGTLLTAALKDKLSKGKPESEETPVAETEEVEETLDMESLMEAVKDMAAKKKAANKKVEEAKKKQVAAKKK